MRKSSKSSQSDCSPADNAFSEGAATCKNDRHPFIMFRRVLVGTALRNICSASANDWAPVHNSTSPRDAAMRSINAS